MQEHKPIREQLCDAALGEPAEFANIMHGALTADFESMYLYVKTQKLVFRRRSSRWIYELAVLTRRWLDAAPLKGKQKAQLNRHLTVCMAIQELFEIIDAQSSQLRIWQASSEDILRSLFG